MLCPVRKRSTLLSVSTDCRSKRSAATRFLPLSEKIRRGQPRLAMNLRRQLMKESTSKLKATSRWQALLVKQVNMQPYRLILDRNTVTSIGPKRSTPVFAKAGRKLSTLQLVYTTLKNGFDRPATAENPELTSQVRQHPFGSCMHQRQVVIPND
ncbi:hypothetical protein M513_09318 [Trichuris suis]|uniref:Uncharacterized protein n=1 Tax=Trichuris suis TaxID=68888 RepID=A0A085LY05_9BILA|nr:hypothetical protein M513_09318 [Trichuris suis]